MTRLFRHWKLIFGLLAIFAVGMATGVIGTVVLLHRVFTRPEPQAAWVDARLGDLSKHLNLTAEQRAKLKPVVDRAGRRFREIGKDAFEDIVRVAEETRTELAKELTPEQRAEFDRLRPQVIAKLREVAQREITVRAHQAVPVLSDPQGPSTGPAPAADPQK